MESFFERVGRFWPAGRRDLHWHILPTEAEAVALTKPYEGLAPPELQSVAVDGMHCTIMHAVGLNRTGIDTDALVNDVGSFAQSMEPFTLTFDRPSVGVVGMEISGWPGQPFTEIVDAVGGAMARTKAAFKAAPSRYLHMSLAYAYAGDVEAVTIKAALAAIAQPLSGTVLVDRLYLVEQWHDGARIMWKPLAEVPLRG